MSTLPSVNLNALYAATGSGATGIDVAGAVNQILYARRATERQWQAQQSLIDQQTASLTQLNGGASQLLNSLDALQDSTSGLMANSVVSAQPAVVSATADVDAVTGTHTVTVQRLATAAAWYSDAEKDGTTAFAPGSFDLTIGSGSSQSTATMALGSGVNTPADLVQYIDGLNLGISASLVTDANGTRVALTSQTTGSANDFTISPALGTQTANIFTRATAAGNASMIVDGVPVSSATNSISGVISGVTLHLSGQAPDTEVILSVGPDMAAAQQAVNGFVSGYNGLVQQVNAQFAYDSVNQAAGPLSGDTTVRMLQSDNKTSLQNHIDDFETYLADEQTRLTNEYNQINIVLLQLPQQQKQINAILGNPSSGSSQ